MIRTEDDGVWVELREAIANHHDEVFACLTTAEGLSRWFPLEAEVDLRQGGQIIFYWDEAKTKRSTVAILDYDSAGYMVWDWYAASNDQHAPVYWKITPHIEKGSIVELRQGPFSTEQDSLLAMAEEAESWRWQLCNLRTVLEVKHDMRPVKPL